MLTCFKVYAGNLWRREELIQYSAQNKRAGVDTTNPYGAERTPVAPVHVKDSYSISNWAGVLDGEG